MITQSFGRDSSPANMIVSGINKCPSFTLKHKSFGFENGFYANGAVVDNTQLAAKGFNLFAENAPRENILLVATSNMIEGHFGTNESAYNRGLSIGQSSAYVVCDFENEYGNYDNPTNLDRVGHFLKGVKDAGALAGEFLYAVWNGINVWSSEAKSQLTHPAIRGIGDKTVPSLGIKLGDLYSFHKVIGYGTNYTTGRQNFDPRTSIYNYIYKFKVDHQLIKSGLVNKNCVSIGFLWGGCDGFGAGKPTVRHRVYLQAPLDGFVKIDSYDEESLNTMKGFGHWGSALGKGVYYWDSRIKSSDKINDVIDIMYSGYPHRSYHGTGNLPGGRPNPVRHYSFIDGLSQDSVYEAAYEISQVEDLLIDSVMADADFDFKRGAGSFQPVIQPVDGTGIVDAYEKELPFVVKFSKGSQGWLPSMVTSLNSSNSTFSPMKTKRTQRQVKRIAVLSLVTALIAALWVWISRKKPNPTLTGAAKVPEPTVASTSPNTQVYEYNKPPKTEFNDAEFSDEFK